MQSQYSDSEYYDCIQSRSLGLIQNLPPGATFTNPNLGTQLHAQ